MFCLGRLWRRRHLRRPRLFRHEPRNGLHEAELAPVGARQTVDLRAGHVGADPAGGGLDERGLPGKYLYGWGAPGGQPGQFNGPHSLTVDQEGNLYTAEVFGGRVQKFRPKQGADPAKVMGQELRLYK